MFRFHFGQERELVILLSKAAISFSEVIASIGQDFYGNTPGCVFLDNNILYNGKPTIRIDVGKAPYGLGEIIAEANTNYSTSILVTILFFTLGLRSAQLRFLNHLYLVL